MLTEAAAEAPLPAAVAAAAVLAEPDELAAEAAATATCINVLHSVHVTDSQHGVHATIVLQVSRELRGSPVSILEGTSSARR